MIPVFKSTKVEKLETAYGLQDALIAALEQTENHTHLVPRVAACHRSYRHWRCDSNHDWAEPENSCSVRVCPHCARRKALIMAGRVEQFTAGRDGLRYAVLAERNSERLTDGMKSLWKAWTRLRRWKRWKQYVKGCIVVMEVTYNPDDMTWHPHLNVLMEGSYFPFEELRQAWDKATCGQGQTSYIRAADEGTVRELIKYVTKVTDLCARPVVLDEFLTAVHGARLIRTYGSFYGMKVEDDELDAMGRCPDCGASARVAVVDLGYVAPQLVSCDARGILRVGSRGEALHDALADAVRVRSANYRGPRWRPVWANPVLGHEPARLRRVGDEYTEPLLHSADASDTHDAGGQTVLRWENL